MIDPQMLASLPAAAAVLSAAVRSGAGPVAQLMRAGGLYCVFQPLADLRSGSIYAHEALIRGPRGMPLHTPDALLKGAAAEGILREFELLAVCVALQDWGRQSAPGRLFVNLSAQALVQAVGVCGPGMVGDTVRSFGVQARSLVVEITEHDHVTDMPAVCAAVKAVHATGARLALDDFGDGRSSLRLWSEAKPDFVKIDKYFIHQIEQRPATLQLLQAIKGIAEVFGTTLIAEGIETEDELRTLRDLGIPYGQGWLLGRPAETAQPQISTQARSVAQDPRVAVLPHQGHSARPGVLRNLMVMQAPCVVPAASNDEVAELFQAGQQLHAIAVVEAGRPLALINRQQFMNHYATLYFREVHGRKPCLAFANVQPRIVELDCDVDQLVGILTSQDQRYLSDGFIVTDNGRYVGLGTGEQLVRRVTEARIEAARHANPLTFLPGNIPISLHMQRLLDSGAGFVACYADLNHFKPFNDHYGYWRGDEMIRLAARTMMSNCDPRRDFVGHVGGDDFVLLFQSDDWFERCEQIVNCFNEKARSLYDSDALELGGIDAEDRHGVNRFFGFTTLSIGALPVRPGVFAQADEVASAAAMAKQKAKQSKQRIAIADAAAWVSANAAATAAPSR